MLTGVHYWRRTVAGRLGLTQRRLQVVLGVFWIVDAILQYQPKMFTDRLVDRVINPAAAGQAAPLAWVINEAARLIRPDVGVWNFLFATIQLAIGVGLLWPRTVKPALVTMFLWSFFVWWVGEGFAMMLMGQGSPLTGAPGAALLCGLMGVLLWPTGSASAGAGRPASSGERSGEPHGLQSAAGASGPFGVRASLGIWSGLWCLFAFLWLQPDNRAADSIGSVLVSAAGGQPAWYGHFLRFLAGGFQTSGSEWAWLLAAVSLVIGLGPLLTRRVTGYFVAGAVLEILFWVSGQSLGGVLTGIGSDPNSGPVVVLLALSVMPTVVEARAAAPARDATGPKPEALPSVLRRLLAWNPIATGAFASGLGALLLLAATYPQPVAAAAASALTGSESSGASSMAGMSGAGPSARAGDPKNMKMAANPLLAPEAMGGSDPSWRYSGPALSPGEVDLLTAVGNLTDEGHKMQTPTCTATPTAAQLENGIRIVQDTSSDVARYRSLAAAVAAGYTPITDPQYPVVHYLKFAYMSSADILNPEAVDSLVYATTPYGPVLAAAMYLLPTVGENGPMPAGCMLQWHAHTNLCTSLKTGIIVGFTPCGPAEVNPVTPYMTHIWQVPVPGGPLALDPSDLQTVEGAIMAQQCGEAPYNPATPPPPPAPGECRAYYGVAEAGPPGPGGLAGSGAVGPLG